MPPTGRGDAASGGTLGLQEPSYDTAKSGSRVLAFDDRQPGPGWSALSAARGSGVGVWAFERGGWALTSWIGFALPVAGLIYFSTEPRAD